ncbi:hypothetical protein KHQ81_12995 [Mycoplasmatota bacterium]|nr:hypothetical protein KHQ81_12995 [Mycoplasmatota bacterium]
MNKFKDGDEVEVVKFTNVVDESEKEEVNALIGKKGEIVTIYENMKEEDNPIAVEIDGQIWFFGSKELKLIDEEEIRPEVSL